ncbi:MAG: amidoligase family protein [Clostridiales bacterium]|nr:amidoligase family protein [Clostridiales bacterium]
MKEELVCSVCGEDLGGNSVHELDGQLFCDRCFDEQTVECDCCHERILRDDAEGNEDIILCSHCYDYSYTNCENCGCLIRRDDANYYDDYPYCDECYTKLEDAPIHSYNYKPEPIFYGSGPLFYGVELEIDCGGEDDDNAEEILKIANRGDFVLYAKHDGSIDEGFELVSEPAALDYHMKNVNWKAVMDTAISMGYRSHNTQTCGLHIHVNRSAFGETAEEQESVIARIVYFVEHHWNELVRFSRRTKGNLNRWAARYATISDSTQKTYKDAKDKNMGRYVAVNLQNYDTVEFRMFRGTLKYETFISALQLVDEICRLALSHNDSEVEDMSWSDFVMKINGKSELIDYLKSKRLYVNEPVEEGADE